MEQTLHQYLKDSTRRRHEQAEQHPFQGALAQGKLPYELYKRYMVQLYHLHDRFETQLQHASEGNANLRNVVNEQLYQKPFLATDLVALGTTADSEPALPVIEQFGSSKLFSQHPESLLGPLYVLLGAKHGGRFIAHQVKQAYDLKEAGYTYFNPYGESFRGLWQDFTAGLNSLPADEHLRNAVLQSADSTFETFVHVGDAIYAALRR